MKPADLALVRLPGAPTAHPEGRIAVVSITRADLAANDTAGQLWEVTLDGSAAPRQLTHGWRDASPRFSPDGQWLAFVRCAKEEKPQLWIMPVAGGEPRRLTDHPLGVGAPVWSPDSTRLAYTARVPEEGRYGATPAGEEAPRRITRMLYRVDGEGFILDRPQHIFVSEVAAAGADAAGADGGFPARQVTEGPFNHRDPAWSPDGQWLAFAAARHDDYGNDLRSDVWVCRADGGEPRALTGGGFSAEQPGFTPDGTAVCFAGVETDPNGFTEMVRNKIVWRVPVDGSAEPVPLLDRDSYHRSHHGRIGVGPAGVLFPNERRGAVELVLIPPDGGEPRVLIGGPVEVVGADVAGDTVVATVADQTNWGEVVVAGTDAGAAPRRVTDWSAGYRAEVPIAEIQEVEAAAPDGYPVHGWVVRPAGDGPHPVLLMIHGGPFTQYGWRLFDEAQVYAGAGYAVVMGNPRGSSGYGQAHGRAIIGNVSEVSAADLVALLDAAVAAPDLDADRVGVLGGSHGGFMTTWLAAHHGTRFKAAISERAVNAIDSFEGSSDIGWFFADAMYGTDPAVRAAQSPLSYADRIDIPMLIIHSEQDWRCPIEQAQRLYVALRRRGTPAELLLFPGEGHELSRTGRPTHRVARFEAILEWWGRYL